MSTKPSTKKQITEAELAQLATSLDYRTECVTSALLGPDAGLNLLGVGRAACEYLREMAETIITILAANGRTSIGEIVDRDGNIERYWLAVKAYLETFGDVPSSPPSAKSPIKNYLTYLMVRGAVRKAAAPEVQRRRDVAENGRRVRSERDRIEQQKWQASEDERLRKESEAARAKAKAAKAKKAARRGTCGIDFAGSSMRFVHGSERVYMYRHDVRRVYLYADSSTLVIVDTNGAEFTPALSGDVAVANREVCDWRWRASEEWENRTRKRITRVDDDDDEYF